MATPVQYIKIVGKTAGSDLTNKLIVLNNVSIANAFRNIALWFESIGIGARSFNGAVFAGSGGVRATQTITISSVANGDTVVLNGVTLTAETSGATGNNQYNIGGSDAQSAINLAALINSATAPAKILGCVVASVANPGTGKVVTLTAIEPGAIGNLFTLTATGGNTAGGATFASGADGVITYLAKGI